MDIASAILIGIMIVSLGTIVLMGLAYLMKKLARYTTDFIFWYRCIPRRVERPDCKESKYYGRFPYKDGTHWEYANCQDDPWLKDLAHTVMQRTKGRSDRYKANYILHLTQYAYTYQKDMKTYGTSEKWAFPVCTGYLHIGDCEDGALFGASLSRACGLDVVMVSVVGHAMYAVNVKGFGKRVEHDGKKYLLCETTAPLPMGLCSLGRLNGCFEVLYPPIDYMLNHTYEDSFEQYKK